MFDERIPAPPLPDVNVVLATLSNNTVVAPPVSAVIDGRFDPGNPLVQSRGVCAGRVCVAHLQEEEVVGINDLECDARTIPIVASSTVKKISFICVWWYKRFTGASPVAESEASVWPLTE